jgi:hypothetical protein
MKKNSKPQDINWESISDGWRERYHEKDDELLKAKERIKELESKNVHTISQTREEPYNGREPYSSQIL